MKSSFRGIVDAIKDARDISKSQLVSILAEDDEESVEYLFKTARAVADSVYGKSIYVRGLVEFTNYCHNDCFYCGIRKSNGVIRRYRLSEDEIIYCAREGYKLGLRTFVLQGGEDDFFTDELLCNIAKRIKSEFADCALTLSVGEKSAESYKQLRLAGVDRYLLRHETANPQHYKKLHPVYQSFDNRMRCLYDLKALGFQTGCGFMTGSPYQDDECLFNDLQFIKKFAPDMVGIGPFITQHDTPFGNMKNGDVQMTLKLLSIVRLILPDVLLPSTTALATLDEQGREKGILAGCNVIMPNLSPISVRKDYALYDDKACLQEESAACLNCIKTRIEKIGYQIDLSRGDHKTLSNTPNQN